MKVLAVLVLAVFLMGCDAEQNSSADPMVLVNNERAFATDVGDVGMRDGFLAHIADDGVLFVPQAVNGKAHYEAQRKRPGLLTWFPIYSEISSGGDMGWTTGPWEWRTDSHNDQAQATGHYITIWLLQPDSTWKFVLDVGVAHSAHKDAAPKLTMRSLEPPKTGGELTVEEARVEMVQVERTFSSASAAQGLVTAYVARMANDVRFYRQGEYPIVGVSDVTTALSQVEGVWTWEVNHAEISSAGDLAYTFGDSRLDNAGTTSLFSYGRIWRRNDNGDWELALDIHIPRTPASIPVDKGSIG